MTAILFVIVVYVIYIKRWKIRYFIFIQMPVYCQRKRRHPPPDDMYDFDAFVSYCAEDRFWVHDVLMKQLETTYGFSLCIHYRDFLLGADVMDEISTKMKNSREIIVVLSETSVAKPYCDVELKWAFSLAIQRRKNLILIKLGDIGNAVESSTAVNVLELYNYLEWTDDMRTNEERQKLFWARLVNRLYDRDPCICGCRFTPYDRLDMANYVE